MELFKGVWERHAHYSILTCQLFAAAILGNAASSHGAIQWYETADAGPLINSAQQIVGDGALTQIIGNLTSGTDRDIFEVKITNPNNFSFQVTSTGQSGGNADTLLALFNSSGIGLVYSDDISDTDFKSILDNSSGLITSPGDYYLAIIGGAQQFNSAGGRIWLEQAPWTNQKAPDGPGGAQSLSGYVGSSPTFVGTYTIDISGGVSPVPESAWTGLMAAGVCLAGLALHFGLGRIHGGGNSQSCGH